MAAGTGALTPLPFRDKSCPLKSRLGAAVVVLGLIVDILLLPASQFCLLCSFQVIPSGAQPPPPVVSTQGPLWTAADAPAQSLGEIRSRRT